jgi:hypothetical protein
MSLFLVEGNRNWLYDHILNYNCVELTYCPCIVMTKIAPGIAFILREFTQPQLRLQYHKIRGRGLQVSYPHPLEQDFRSLKSISSPPSRSESPPTQAGHAVLLTTKRSFYNFANILLYIGKTYHYCQLFHFLTGQAWCCLQWCVTCLSISQII